MVMMMDDRDAKCIPLLFLMFLEKEKSRRHFWLEELGLHRRCFTNNTERRREKFAKTFIHDE